MAKLLRQAFRPKTHDDGDSSLRELGATGVFRNLAFQDSEDPVSTPKVFSGQSSNGKKSTLSSTSVEEQSASSALSSSCRGSTPSGAEMWATPPATPSAGLAAGGKRQSLIGGGVFPPPSPGAKRAAIQSACQTPKTHRLSLLRSPKNITEVQEIGACDLSLKDGSALHIEQGDDSAAVTVRRSSSAMGAAPALAVDDDDDDAASSAVPYGPLTSPVARSCVANAVRLWEEGVKRLVLAGRMDEAVVLTAPSDGIIRCTLRRVRNFMGQTIAYHLFLDSGDTFLMAARKRKKSANSDYVLSTSHDNLGRDSEHRVCKLRANFVGTEYSLCSRGPAWTIGGVDGSAPASTAQQPRPSSGRSSSSAAVNPDDNLDSSPPGAAALTPSGSRRQSPARQLQPSGQQNHHHGDAFRREEVAVHFKQTALTAKGGPRVMLVATPLPDSNWCPTLPDGSDSLATCLELARRRELPPRLERQLCMLATRPPEWDPALKSYTLDFHGRVRASSVKNFQLVHWDHNTDRKGADLVLQFGKVEDGSDDFALDFTYPLTLQKAFGIALASTDAKLCYAL